MTPIAQTIVKSTNMRKKTNATSFLVRKGASLCQITHLHTNRVELRTIASFIITPFDDLMNVTEMSDLTKTMKGHNSTIWQNTSGATVYGVPTASCCTSPNVKC